MLHYSFCRGQRGLCLYASHCQIVSSREKQHMVPAHFHIKLEKDLFRTSFQDGDSLKSQKTNKKLVSFMLFLV